ncbi:MAG TPA: type II toxin-antitoxin system RelE/ParE family toxin [Rhizobacter sp.]|nr:type II toxin-antitoxin system RelE/ParE family toxin [Rhizobacter sp.]
MEFVETPTFTRLVTELLTDEDYRALQNLLLADPQCGALIRDGGGIRKMRFAAQGRGKSGGVRAIYYWAKTREQIYMLVIYPKSVKDTLSARETALLRTYVKELAKEL